MPPIFLVFTELIQVSRREFFGLSLFLTFLLRVCSKHDFLGFSFSFGPSTPLNSTADTALGRHLSREADVALMGKVCTTCTSRLPASKCGGLVADALKECVAE